MESKDEKFTQVRASREQQRQGFVAVGTTSLEFGAVI